MYTIDEVKREYLKGNTERYSPKENPQIEQFITAKVQLDIPYKAKVYCFIHSVTPKCKACNNIPAFISFKVGFREYCSTSCQVKDQKSQQEENRIKNIQDTVKDLSIDEIIRMLYNKELKIQKYRDIAKLDKYKHFRTLEQIYKHVILKESQICPQCSRVLDYAHVTKETRKCSCTTETERLLQNFPENDTDFIEFLIENNLFRPRTVLEFPKIQEEYYKRFSSSGWSDSLSEDLYIKTNNITEKPETKYINFSVGYQTESTEIDILGKTPKEIKYLFIQNFNSGRFNVLQYKEFLSGLVDGDSQAEKEYLIDHKRKYCKVCSSKVRFISHESRYLDTCSIACSNRYFSQIRTESAKNTFIKTKLKIILQSYDVQLLDEYKDVKTEHSFLCNVCKTEFKTNFGNGIWCRNCNPINSGTSLKEQDVLKYIKRIYKGEILSNDRSFGVEFDIYIPQKKVAIEFNGLYWHSARFKDKDYHLRKTQIAEEHGIQLIHIFENEWKHKRKICESILAAKLGLIERKIPARKCSIKSITSKESKEFLEKNHIQGNVNASEKFGLFFSDELIQVMTFGRSHRSKDKYLELKRFCSLLSVTVMGGFSKLLKHSKNILQKDIFTFADRRFSSEENVYSKIGTLVGISGPNYFYLMDNNLESREKYQKHKLMGILENFSPALTEKENMSKNGYFCIYDCGNYKYKL